ncbi:hypothetical protein Tco_0702614 [Tanacetum coccineum]|uniref:Reverse transcriptase domain-containing protein n=1 Tax=Tanacetum coccineum TaxID=301880 RepID=A0ABQ4XY21_9ASTR
MDDEPMWAADHVVAPTPGPAISIPETANEFSIKGNHLTLVKGKQFDGMPNYSKFLKELVSNKHKLEQISSAFLSDKSSAIIQNKVPPKLGDPGSFLSPCTFGKAFSCNTLADLGASINLIIDVIDEILEEDFDSLLYEGSKILYSIDGTLIEDQIFTEFDEFMAINIKENSKSDSDKEEITFDADYKIKKSLDEPPTDLELK